MVRSRVLSILLTHILRDKIPDTRINVILLVADKIFAWAASVATIANSNIITNFAFVNKKERKYLYQFEICAIMLAED